MNLIELAVVVMFVFVFALAVRAQRRVGRLLRRLKAEEYALWSELSIWRSFLEPGRTILLLDNRFWSRVRSAGLLEDRRRALRALAMVYGAGLVLGGCFLWLAPST